MTKALLATIVSCLAIAGAVYGSPQIHVEEPIYDFGSILEGFAVTHVFTIENVGDEALEILSVSASCGCTTTELATSTLAPGESVGLEILINTTGFGGRISKSIYVYINDDEHADSSSADRPRFTLRVTGEVLRAQDYHISVSDMNYLFTLLIDLRDPVAYAEAHLMGAVNIPYEQLADWLDRLPTNAFIVLYDQDGQVSEQTARELAGIGYSTVYYVLGGLDEWTHWHEAFFLQTAVEPFETPDREERDRLTCPADEDKDRQCTDIAKLRYLLYLLIDLRNPAAYDESHLLGAVNIPDSEISARLGSLPKGVSIILYDDANERSDAAAQMMLNAGFNQVRSLLGGLDEWIRQFDERFVKASSESE